jgi:hypothetical protein
VGGIGRPLKLFFVSFEFADCIFFSLEELWRWACVGKEETEEVNFLLECFSRRGLIALGSGNLPKNLGASLFGFDINRGGGGSSFVFKVSLGPDAVNGGLCVRLGEQGQGDVDGGREGHFLGDARSLKMRENGEMIRPGFVEKEGVRSRDVGEAPVRVIAWGVDAVDTGQEVGGDA